MAREALNRHSSANGISSYRQKNKGKKDQELATCQSCKIAMEKFSWSKRQKKMIERKLCLAWWRQNNSRSNSSAKLTNTPPTDKKTRYDAGATAIGSITRLLKLSYAIVFLRATALLKHLRYVLNRVPRWVLLLKVYLLVFTVLHGFITFLCMQSWSWILTPCAVHHTRSKNTCVINIFTWQHALNLKIYFHPEELSRYWIAITHGGKT